MNVFAHVSHLNSLDGATVTRTIFVPQVFLCISSLSFLLLVSVQPIFCNSCVTNTTVHSCMVVSNVVLEHVSSLEFFLTHMTGGLFYLVILQEVFVETTFVTEIFATFMTCDSRDFLRVGVHCGMSLV